MLSIQPVSTIYVGRRVALGTKHDKLAFIAPPLWSRLGMTVTTVDVDTDQLGTFSGEIPRLADPVTTAIRKARLGMAAAGCSIGLGSEGSIVDPWGIGALVVDREWVALVDDDRELTVIGQATSTDVVAVAATVGLSSDLDDLVRRANVPPHHLIVSPVGIASCDPHGSPNPRWSEATTKGVGSTSALGEAVALAISGSPVGRARVETDLRAHLCPSRGRVIAAAAADLATRLATPCPRCASPGWGLEGVDLGRPCAWCGGPTDEVVSHRWRCPSCALAEAHSVEALPSGDPGRCPRCNP